MKKFKLLFLIVCITSTLMACTNNSTNNAASATSDSSSANKDSTSNTKYNPATPGAQNGQ